MGKLFVITASQSPAAVILRRGPSKWYHVISWNTRTDHIEHGAWFKGRIYEDKCDLSPDGKLFVSFMLKESNPENGMTNTWTALSRPPWLQALALWPHGGTYGGGGRFTGNRKLAMRPLCPGLGDVCHTEFPNHYVSIDRNTLPEHHQSAEIVPNADWSGYDQETNIIYSKNDKLFRIRKKGGETEVADFSDLVPSPQPAPDWATTFP